MSEKQSVTIAPADGKLGVLIPGLGAVATTFIAGVELVKRGLVASADTGLYLVTDDVDQAVQEIVGFYANFDSMRYVGDLLVIRLHREVTDEELFLLNARFGHLCASGSIKRVPALDPERRENDKVDLPRIGFVFAKHGYGELRALIDTLNGLVAAPPPA